MKKKAAPRLTVALLSATFLMTGFLASSAQANRADEKDKYVATVVSILRSHVTSIRQLTKQDIKYSDNVVRHAVAIRHAFGMLGPMDWHVAKSIQLNKLTDDKAKLDEKAFQSLADQSQDSVKYLARAAQRWLRDGKRDLLMGSVTSMMNTCNNCHSQLPEDTAPAVWKGMTE